MDNTLLSLAILKVNWDHLKKDYIENFIPFIATLIDKNRYEEININEVCDDFKKEFGLIIPYHPMCTILNRARKKGLINKRGDRYIPNRDKITKYDFSSNANDQLRKHEKVTSEFIGFADKTYNATLTKEDADTALISFLKNHDVDILFAASQSTVLPPIKISNEKKFLIYSFIKHVHQSEPEIFRFIVDIAIGYILASTLLYSEFDKFKGKLSGIDFYFDTRCILRLLGVEGRERKEAYAEFILTLAEEGANLFIFRHSFEEITSILEDCLRWIESTRYDPSLASPALKYFVQNNYKGSDVERLIVNVENILKDKKIQIVESPDPNKYQFYQIDEKKLYENIIATYKEHNPSFPELEKSFTIQRDVKSIANVNKLRRGRHPKNIKEAGSIFVTTNSGLAFANKRFEQAEKSEGAIIPACLTDIFVGTLVWLQTPAKVLSLNERR